MRQRDNLQAFTLPFRTRGSVFSTIRPLLEARQPRQPKATYVTTLRLDEDMEKRLKHVAALKKVPYQTLFKQFVAERLYEEEKRLGVI